MFGALCDFLARYQIVAAGTVTGLFGFAGIVTGLIWNRRITQDRVRDERTHERRVLVHSLLAELQVYENAITSSIETLRSPKGEFSDAAIPSKSNVPVFDVAVSKIGLLDVVTINPVLVAYLNIKEYDRALVFMSTEHGSGQYRLVGAKYVQPLASMLDHLRVDVRKATEALQRVLD